MEILNYRTYLTTLKLVFLKAISDLYPEHEVVFLNSLNNGLYGKIIYNNHVFREADYDKTNDALTSKAQIGLR